VILKKIAATPRQNSLAIALREIGRIERTIFICDWLLDPRLRRRSHAILNKGESRHALAVPCSFINSANCAIASLTRWPIVLGP
jgi:TnpA family transposase